MKPIYFPYTYISNPVAEALASCFGRFTVYQLLSDKLPLPMQPWVDKGVVDIRIPVEGDTKALISAADNFQNWASLNVGNAGMNPASLKTLKATALPGGASLSSQIVAEVKKQIKGSGIDKSSDPVLAARIFLYFAQAFDQQSRELDHVLDEFQKKEQDLIRDLKMEEDALAAEFKKEPGHMPDVNTDYLIAERLEAWTRILFEDEQPPELFVTHSKAVLEQLLDNTPTAEKILEFEAIPRLTTTVTEVAPWQEQLILYLSDIAREKNNVASGFRAETLDIPTVNDSVTLKIYLVPDQNYYQLFGRAAGIKNPESARMGPTAGAQNTLLGLVGF